MLPDVVARHGEFHGHWAGHDVYVAGSVPMVRATIARLQELDIPLANIRFDAYSGMDGLWQPGTSLTDESYLLAGSSVVASPAAWADPSDSWYEAGHGSQASKSSSTAGVNGLDWQASTNPSAFSSGSKA
jgi:hypothetical protein